MTNAIQGENWSENGAQEPAPDDAATPEAAPQEDEAPETPEEAPSLTDDVLLGISPITPETFDQKIRQHRADAAKLATVLAIQNELSRGESVIEVKGDKLIPRVIADVLALYRKAGWQGDERRVEFVWDANKRDVGAYRFSTVQSIADARPPVGRSVSINFGSADDERAI